MSGHMIDATESYRRLCAHSAPLICVLPPAGRAYIRIDLQILRRAFVGQSIQVVIRDLLARRRRKSVYM